MDIATLAMKIDTSDVERADSALDRLGEKGAKAEQAAKGVGDAYQQAGSKLGAAASTAAEAGEAFSRGANSARSQARELSDLIAKIDPATAAMKRLGDQQEQLSRFNLSGMLDGEQYKRLNAMLDEQRTALARSGDAMKLAGISAGQYTQAMRLLPMQLTDVVTSLASGMPVWQVAIQQGGQVRDSFGGIGNAARAVLSAIGPTTLALGGVGAALGGVVAAYYAGAQESSRFNEALILTGNHAGKTAGELADLAIKMDALGGVTQGSAAEALTQVVATGKIAGDQIEMVATAAEQMRVATGKSIEETIAEFVKIGDAPVSALLDLNDKYHFLTQAQLDQIQALKEQGKLEEAASAGMRVYADTIAERAPKAVENLGWIERKWRDLKDAMRETLDGAASLGRAPGQDQQVKSLNERIAYLKSTVGTGYEPLADTTGEIAKLEAQLTALTAKKTAAETVDSGLAKSGQQYLDTLKAQSIQVQDLSYHEQALQKIKTRGIDASSALGRQILAEADIVDKNKAKKEADTKAEREAEQAKRKMATATESATKRLNEYLGQSSVSATAAEAMAKAYFSGSASVRELTIQQKIEQELLKTGAGARDAVTAAVNRQQNALDRLDLGKRYADLKLDTDQLHAQAVATLGGTESLRAFNEQKLLASALAGKNADALGTESKALLEQIHLNQEAAKAVEQAGKAQGIIDRLYPQQKLLRDYTEEQQALNKAIELYPEKADQYRAALERLGVEYEANKRSTTAWGQWTVSALERVDSAFADAWKNIGGGFKSFRNSLTDAFRQMLAELAHMAITKPIVLSIGAALGIGGSQQALANGGSGIWGMLSGSGGSGGGSFGSLLSYGQSAYNVLTGVGPAALAGYQSGGVMGGLSGVGSYYGSMLSNAYGSVAGWFGGGASAAGLASTGGLQGVNVGIDAIKYADLGAQSVGSAASSASSLSSSLSTVGTGLAAVGSALAIYNSYQQNGVKGAVLTGGAAAAGFAVGGPIGAAIGSAVGNFLSGKLFGGSWQTKDYGLALDVTAGDFGAQSFEYQKKKGGLFGKNKSRTRYNDLPADTLSGLEQTWAATENGVAGLYEQLGLHIQAGTLDGLQIAQAQISTKGKTEEEIQKAVTEWFTKAGESLNTYLNQTFDTGLSYDLAGMTTFVQNLQSVNAMLTNLNVGLFDASVAGGRMAENLSAISGGFEALATSSATYYDKFFSATEKAGDTLAAVQKQFASLNLTLPETRAEYRAMVEAIDITSNAGRSMFSSLMGMAGAADSAFTILEQRSANAAAVAAEAAANALAQAKGQADSAYAALQRSIGAQKDAVTAAYNAQMASLNDMASTAQANVSALNSVGTSLSGTLKQLLGTSESTTRVLREQAKVTLQSALATARAGGSLDGFAGLSDALAAVGSNNTDLYRTLEDYNREQGRTANMVAELDTLNGKQLSAAEQLLARVQAQIDQAKQNYDATISRLDSQLSYAQSQLDAINGVDNSVTSVADAIATMGASIVAALAALPAGAAAANTPENNASIVDSVYQAVLGRTADQGGSQFWAGQLQSGGIEYSNLASTVAGAALRNSGESDPAKSNASAFLGRTVSSAYQAALGRTADAGGAAFWANELASGAVTASSLVDSIRKTAIANGELPAFANGGMHAGGMAMVGERGPELMVSGPARIYNASQTADMLGGSTSTAAEVRGLRADMAQVFDALRAIAKHTMQTAKRVESLERWDYDGMPAVRA